jgi:predicted nucleic acid-binding protein
VSVIVDTSVWSLSFRRNRAVAPEASALAELLERDDALLVGPVRQEILSGIREAERFRKLRDTLRQWPDYPLTTNHFEAAAESYNACRAEGVQGSDVDFLLCAVSLLDGFPIFATDGDFELYARHLPITLFRTDSP